MASLGHGELTYFFTLLFQLFELLGFDRFELIQELLQNRRDLVAATKDKAARLMLSKAPGMCQ